MQPLSSVCTRGTELSTPAVLLPDVLCSIQRPGTPGAQTSASATTHQVHPEPPRIAVGCLGAPLSTASPLLPI